jgi:hypothetical protein
LFNIYSGAIFRETKEYLQNLHFVINLNLKHKINRFITPSPPYVLYQQDQSACSFKFITIHRKKTAEILERNIKKCAGRESGKFVGRRE